MTGKVENRIDDGSLSFLGIGPNPDGNRFYHCKRVKQSQLTDKTFWVHGYSDVTPPTVESGVANNGLYTEELVNLTDMLVGNIDYDDYSLAYSIQLNAEQAGSTATIIRLHTGASGTASRAYQNVGDSPKVNFTGYKTNGHPVNADSTSAVFTQINSHDKTNSVEKWFDVNGQLTSADDGDVTPTNNGLSINTSGTATTYNVKFVGKYRFIMLSDCLTDAQLNTLKTSIDAFLS